MRIRFHNRAVKSLERLDAKDRERIRLKLKSLVGKIDAQGVFSYKEFDIKRLEGEWDGFLRMRIGRMRIIFQIEKEDHALLVYEIDHRGDVYK